MIGRAMTHQALVYAGNKEAEISIDGFPKITDQMAGEFRYQYIFDSRNIPGGSEYLIDEVDFLNPFLIRALEAIWDKSGGGFKPDNMDSMEVLSSLIGSSISGLGLTLVMLKRQRETYDLEDSIKL